MQIPFTIGAFLGVFEAYNRAIQPFQILAYVLAIISIALAIKKGPRSDKIISGILATFWLWMGVVYHIGYFSMINEAAYLFGSLFILQGGLFVYFGVIKETLSFKLTPGISSAIGAVFIVYAMIIYPVLNHYFGHGYPKMPVFGVAPCPTTIFTFGLFLWSTSRVPIYVIAIPFLWSLIGVSAAMSSGVIEDFGLIVAGIIGSILVVLDNYKKTALA